MTRIIIVAVNITVFGRAYKITIYAFAEDPYSV